MVAYAGVSTTPGSIAGEAEMPNDRAAVRSYLEVGNPTPALVAAFSSGDTTGIRQEILKFLPRLDVGFEVLPPPVWTPRDAVGKVIPVPRSRIVIPIERQERRDTLPPIPTPLPNITLNADLPIALCDAWCPTAADDLFGTTADAERLMGNDDLRRAGATGKGVNVLVVDQGLNKRPLPHYGGGFDEGTVRPGESKGGHGMMVARNVLALAPAATLWDCPLIPDAIADVGTFLAHAASAMNRVLETILDRRLNDPDPIWTRPWVIVNSWAVYDRSTDNETPYDYIDNPRHAFNLAMDRADQMLLDVVFAAGNCGAICAKSRCGPLDRGPGQSILGANSHPKVLTLGAVRTDTMWIGYSSQGPGQRNLAREKPDLVAPSSFSEVGDRSTGNTGTSTSAALAAGGLAALRSLRRFDPASVSPDAMRARLRQTASGRAWDRDIGYGILNAGKAL